MFYLINSRKVEKSYWQSPLLQIENIHKQFKTGLEQASDTILPDIRLWSQFKPFVEDSLPKLLSGQRCFIVQPGNYPLLPADSNIATTLALGPEGGFIPYEIEKLIAELMYLKQVHADLEKKAANTVLPENKEKELTVEIEKYIKEKTALI